MNPLISLVIPIYNVEKYLDKCMDSVLAQTYDNFEVILVDDGSTDNSGKMCDEYAKRDSRVTVYHKPNGGLSDARNFGVEHCNADLVSFVDSDDYVTEDYLEYLWYLMDKYSADLSVGQFIRVSEKQTDIKLRYEGDADFCLDTEDALKRLCIGNGISTVACGKLYKKGYVINNKFPFGKYYEDIATTYKLVGNSKIVAVGNEKIYYYLQRDMSILHSTINDKHMFGLIAAEEMCNYISNRFPNLIAISHVRCCTTALDIIIRSFYSKDSDKKYYCEAAAYLKKHFEFIKHLKDVGALYKIDCRMYANGYTLAKIYHTLRRSAAKLSRAVVK